MRVDMETMSPIKVKGGKFKRRPLLDTPRIGKKTSVVWHFFKSLPHENGISRAVCLLCKEVFKNPGGSTTGMRGHLERKHPGVIQRVTETDKLKVPEPKPSVSFSSESTMETSRGSITPPPPPPHLSIENGTFGEVVGETEIFESDFLPGPPPSVYSSGIDVEETTKSIVMYLAAAMQPLRTVEEAHYKKMLNNLNSGYMLEAGGIGDSVINAVVSVMKDLYREAREDIQRKLQGKHCSLHLELWVKANSEIYVLVSANYTSPDWRRRPEPCFLGLRLLPDICLISRPHLVTEKVSQVVNGLLEEYRLKSAQIFHVLFNSAPFSLTSNIISVNTWPCLNAAIRQSYDLLNELVVSVTSCNLLHNALKIAKQAIPTYKDVKYHPGKLLEAIKSFLVLHSTDCTPVKVEDLEEMIKLQQPLNTMVDLLLETPTLTSSSILPLIVFVRNAYQTQVNQDSSDWSKEHRQEIGNAIANQIETCYKIDLSSSNLGDSSTLGVCSFLDPRYKKLNFLTREQHVRQVSSQLPST